jgi:hypothetical protein
MPRPLILSLDGEEIPVSLTKVEREALYGKVEIEAFDERKQPAEIKILSADGSLLIDKGGTALETLDQEGNSLERDEFKPVDPEGKELKPVPSSFDEVNVLKQGKVEDYLSLVVKSVYMLDSPIDSDLDAIKDQLADGRILHFPFSYRSSIEQDDAYLIGSKKDVFMIVGTKGTLQFLSLGQVSEFDTSEEQEVSSEDLSFDL